MKPFLYKFSIIMLLITSAACNKYDFNDVSFADSASTAGNLSVMFDITQDNTGLVTIFPNGEGAVSYDVYFGDATTSPAKIAAGKNVQHTYVEGVYSVKIVAYNITGKTTEFTKQLTVSFRAPENMVANIAVDAGNSMKVNVSASALYETVFKVYFGDVVNEVPVSMLEGETLSHTYAAPGTYTVKVVALSGGAASTTITKAVTVSAPVVLPITFESTIINYAFVNFDGGNSTVVNNPSVTGINTSAKVGKMVKNSGQTWGGSWIGLGKNIDFTNNKYVRMKVFSSRAGAKILFKVENSANAAISYEKEASTTVTNAWETLVWDFSGIDASKSYDHIVLIMDNGKMGDGTAGYTFYFDDIDVSNVSPLAQMDLPVTFDLATVNYAVSDFGNNVTVDATDPVNAANKVKKTTKVNGAETWAGTTMGTGGLGFANKVPFAVGATKMNIKIYSPAAGIKVKLKVEDHTNGTRSVETDALTTVANGWEVLTFDFANQSTGTAAINYSYTYDMASVFFDFGNAGTGKIFYWDDVKFGDGASATSLGLPMDFQSSTLTYAFNDFDGGNATVVNNPFATGSNTSTKVGKMVKNAGQTWGGSWIALTNPINFTGTTKTFKMKVYAPRVGAKVLLKVENKTDGGISYEKEVSTTVANAWETLTFDYSGINTANSYQKIVLIFDNGTMGNGSSNYTYYFDDITLQ